MMRVSFQILVFSVKKMLHLYIKHIYKGA